MQLIFDRAPLKLDNIIVSLICLFWQWKMAQWIAIVLPLKIYVLLGSLGENLNWCHGPGTATPENVSSWPSRCDLLSFDNEINSTTRAIQKQWNRKSEFSCAHSCHSQGCYSRKQLFWIGLFTLFWQHRKLWKNSTQQIISDHIRKLGLLYKFSK